jgi:hypothetical protein
MDARYEIIFSQRITGPYVVKPGTERRLFRGPERFLSWEAQVQLEHWFRGERDNFYVLVLTWTDNRALWKHPHEEHTLLEERHSDARAIRRAIVVFDERVKKLEERT